MAEKKTTEQPPDLRIAFAEIAFRAIVEWQLLNGKFTEQALAASLAFRWADQMVAASKIPPSDRKSLNVKGKKVEVDDEPLPQIDPPLMAPEMAGLPGGTIPST